MGRSILCPILTWLVALVLLTAPVPPAWGQSDLTAAAKREGKVVVYGSVEADTFEVVQRIFEGKYGISVDYWRAASNRVADRVLTEARAGRPLFDIVLLNRSPILILKKEGVFGRYISPSYESFPSADLDRDGVLSPPYLVMLVSVLYNTRLVTPEAAPKSLADLLSPRWKGKIVMPDPTVHPTTAVWLSNLGKVMGTEAPSFVDRLAGQVGLVESFIPAVQKVIIGEFSLGLTYVKYVHTFGQHGAPLDYVRLTPVLSVAHHVAVGAKAPHPNAGKLFVDLLTSRLGLLALAQAGEFVVVPGVYPTIKDAEKLKIVLMDDLDEQGLNAFRARFGRFFQR